MMMMDGKSSKPEAGRQDWRAELAAETRQKVVNRIVNSLKKRAVVNSQPDFLEKINIIAKRFEEKAFQTATTRANYVSIISRKMHVLPESTGSSHPPGQSSGSDTIASGSDDVSGFPFNSVDNIFPSSQGMPVSSELAVHQVCQQQELRNEILKDKAQDTNNCFSLVQSNLSNRQYHQQEQCFTPPPQPYHSTLGQLSNNILFQQQSIQQHGVSQCVQRPNLKLNSTKVFQQSLGQQSDGYILKLQQKIDVPQSHASNMQLHQHSTHMLQQGGFTAAELNAQKVMQPVSDSRNQGVFTQLAMQQSPTVSATASLYQQQNQSNRLQSGTSTASNESKALTENANLVDQDDLSYRKLQAMKRQYGPHLLLLYKQFTSLCNKATAYRPEKLLLFQKHLKIIERFLNVLKLEKSQITPMHKEKMDQYPQAIVNFLTSVMRKKPTSVEQKPQLFQPPSDHSQMPQLHQNRNANIQFHPVNLALTTSLQTSSTASSMQPGVPNSQPNVCRSQQYGSGMEWEQKNVSWQMQQLLRPRGQIVLDAPLQCNTLLNAVDASLNHQSMVPPPNLKQHGHQQNSQLERQYIMIQNTKTGTIQGIEPLVNPHQTPVPAIPCQPHVTSPQMSQNSSLLLGQNTLPSVSKSGTPLQSVASPVVISSSTPLTPSSMLLNQGRECSGVSPTMMSEEHRNPKPHSFLAQADTQSQIYNQSPVTPGLMASPILPESTCPNGNQHSFVQKQPVERLIKAVERLSAQELSAAFDEISSVVNMVDMFAGTEAGSDSRSAIGEDLGTETRCNVLTGNFSSHASINARDMMHQTRAITSDILFSVGTTDGEKLIKHQLCNFDSTATSRIKRQRTSQKDYLLDEIKSINQSLVETMIGLESNDDPVTSEAYEGTIVRCSYNAVAFSENIKTSATSLMFPELSLRLFIPPNYPNSSPVILDRSPVGWRHGINDSEDLLEETMTRYVINLGNLSEPMSIGDMARSWDSCARAVLFEKAKLIGGECFSSRYGSWENCITA